MVIGQCGEREIGPRHRDLVVQPGWSQVLKITAAIMRADRASAQGCGQQMLARTLGNPA